MDGRKGTLLPPPWVRCLRRGPRNPRVPLPTRPQRVCCRHVKTHVGATARAVLLRVDERKQGDAKCGGRACKSCDRPSPTPAAAKTHDPVTHRKRHVVSAAVAYLQPQQPPRAAVPSIATAHAPPRRASTPTHSCMQKTRSQPKRHSTQVACTISLPAACTATGTQRE